MKTDLLFPLICFVASAVVGTATLHFYAKNDEEEGPFPLLSGIVWVVSAVAWLLVLLIRLENP